MARQAGWEERGITVVCVHPSDPETGLEPPPYAAGGETTPDPRRKRKLRMWVAMAAGILGILCLGGVGVAVLLYDEETKIDRIDPDQVTSSFLRTYLVGRSDQEATLFTCRKAANLDQIAALREEMVEREKRFGTLVTASWESLTVSTPSNGSTSVNVDLVISGSKNNQQVSSRTEAWRFGLVDEDGGWRVCNATKAA